MNVKIGSAPDSWGVWFPNDTKQTPWQRYLDEVVQAGYEWSGGSGAVPLEALVELGLVIADGRDMHSSFTFKVPRVVAARMPVWPDLVSASNAVTPELAGAGATGLGIVELLAVLCHALRDGLAGPPPTSGDAARAGPLPSG